MSKLIFASLSRIADFEETNYDVQPLGKDEWETSDYVEAVVTGEPSELYNIEDREGLMVPVEAGDRVVGALGDRAATLEGVGSWAAVEGKKMQALTNAGLFGLFTSISKFLARPISLEYRGHLMRDGKKLSMLDYAVQSESFEFTIPTILLVGTSMSAGKTETGRLVVKELSKAGYDVIGAKLTGAGRFRDVLSYRNKGASKIFDFVDVGLPSTVVSEDQFRSAIRPLLNKINDCAPDFLVAEAGASPLEPYNGAAAMEELGDNICCTILCASDPYAVVGVQHAFQLRPDLVTGPTTNTSAGIDLVKKLTGVDAINILDEASLPAFQDFLSDCLKLDRKLN
jgi:hypothetical protein